MKEACYWPTEVSFFEWGAIYNTPTIQVDGQTITQSQYVDFVVADYWGYVTPWGDLTPAQCSAASIQLNYGDTFYGYKRALENGYGWIMWFAFDPSGTGGIRNNRAHSMEQFQAACLIDGIHAAIFKKRKFPVSQQLAGGGKRTVLSPQSPCFDRQLAMAMGE
jgi:hypothetical protein